MREETKYQNSPYLDEIEALKRDLRSSVKTNLDDYHPLTINAVDPKLLRDKDKKVLNEKHGFNFKIKKSTPAKKTPAKKAASKAKAKK